MPRYKRPWPNERATEINLQELKGVQQLKKKTFLVESNPNGGFLVHVYYYRPNRQKINEDLRKKAGGKWHYHLRRWVVPAERQADLRKLLIEYGQVD